MHDQIKATVIDLVVKQIMKYVVDKASYLTWGPLNMFTKLIVKKVVVKAIEFGVLELGSIMIKIEVNKEVKEIRDLVNQYKDKTAKEKKELDEKLKKAYDNIIKF